MQFFLAMLARGKNMMTAVLWKWLPKLVNMDLSLGSPKTTFRMPIPT